MLDTLWYKVTIENLWNQMFVPNASGPKSRITYDRRRLPSLIHNLINGREQRKFLDLILCLEKRIDALCRCRALKFLSVQELLFKDVHGLPSDNSKPRERTLPVFTNCSAHNRLRPPAADVMTSAIPHDSSVNVDFLQSGKNINPNLCISSTPACKPQP